MPSTRGMGSKMMRRRPASLLGVRAVSGIDEVLNLLVEAGDHFDADVLFEGAGDVAVTDEVEFEECLPGQNGTRQIECRLP